jgi:hypothetical protein
MLRAPSSARRIVREGELSNGYVGFCPVSCLAMIRRWI